MKVLASLDILGEPGRREKAGLSMDLGFRWTSSKLHPASYKMWHHASLFLSGPGLPICSMEINPLPLEVAQAVEGFIGRLSGGRLKEK